MFSSRTLGFLIALTTATTIRAQDFTNMDLDALMAVNVTSVSRKLESLFSASAAINVVTSEELSHLGGQNIALALRLVPGMQVARIDPYNYAVSPRGFNDISANKTLALVDGRNIYSPLFGGVAWGQEDLLIEDVERIEVIRGPGATLWGANAVNGVINVTTKSAAETVGSFLQGTIGDGGTRHAVAARQGFAVGKGYARFYAQHTERDFATGTREIQKGQPWTSTLLGARYDLGQKSTGHLTLLADYRKTESRYNTYGYTLQAPYVVQVEDHVWHRSGHLQASYEREAKPGTGWSVRSSFEHLDQGRLFFNENRSVWDLETQVHHQLSDRHDLVVGASTRFHRDQLESGTMFSFRHPRQDNWLGTGFIQDEIRLIPNRLSVTVGSKVEHNAFTGWEAQPSIRGTWTYSPRLALWAAVSRAVRTPARGEHDIQIDLGNIPPSAAVPVPIEFLVNGTPDFGHETLLAWESGLRFRPSATLQVDIASYVNEYDGIRSIEPTGTVLVTSPVPHLVASNTAGNGIRGNTYGAELGVRWSPPGRWRFQVMANVIRFDLNLAPGSRDFKVIETIPNATPRYQLGLLSQVALTEHWSLDVFTQHVAELPGTGVPAYTTMDVRLEWRPSAHLEFAAVGRDLLDPQHPEFLPTYLGGPTREIARSFFLEVSWRH